MSLLLRLPLLAALGAVSAVAFLGCPDGDERGGSCAEDADCGDPALFRCDGETRECRCRTDGACAEGEICNQAGYCQDRLGCHESRDCPAGHFCDVAASLCRPEGQCASDFHCPPGQLCDVAAARCVAGCRTHGDCRLGDVCLCSTAIDGGIVEAPCGCDPGVAPEACAIGRCAAGSCLDDGFCGYGEVCRAPPDGGARRCEDDYDPLVRPYCDNCVYRPGQDTCGEGPNFCLYSTYTGTTYCGVDCNDGQSCPNGYECKDVIVVWTAQRCDTPEDCKTPDRRTELPCVRDADCPNHGLCDQATGFCYGNCVFNEGARESFCACVEDDDCAQDSCDPITRRCSVTKRACDPDGAPCRPIRCVDMGTKGGCHIGANCKPLTGLTCGDLKDRVAR